MKVQLHLHTSRYSDCCAVTPSEMMQAAIREGYEAVFITEHDAVWQDHELAWLRGQFPSLRIFPGLELSIGTWVQHLLVLGTNDPVYLDISETQKLLETAREGGHLTVLAHPLRWAEGAQMIHDGHLPDAMEYFTPNHDPYRARQAKDLADRLGLPVVNSGDVHSVEMLQPYWIESHRPLEQADEIRQIVLDRAYTNCVRDE